MLFAIVLDLGVPPARASEAAMTRRVFYADADHDRHGDPGVTRIAHEPPPGYTRLGDDCDDTQRTVHPGAVERCNEVDDDCDAIVDEGCLRDLATAADVVVLGYSDRGGAVHIGEEIAVGDLDDDGAADLLLGSRYAAAGAGRAFVVHGPATGRTLVADETVLSTTTRHGDFGAGVAIGDTNMDGFDDALVSASRAGAAYLLLGPVTADRDVGDADAELMRKYSDRVAVLSDFDGDGQPDVCVGTTTSYSYDGSVYVLPGDVSGSVATEDAAIYRYRPVSPDDGLARSFTDIGDTTGDGIDELAVGAIQAGIGGVVYVIEGGAPPGTLRVDVAADATLRRSASAYGAFGTSLDSLDSDGDGTMDLVVGAPQADNPSGLQSGRAFLFLGPFSGATFSHDAAARWTIRDVDDAELGWSVAGGGDVDGDGEQDILLGADHAGGSFAGAAFLQLGSASGVIDVKDLLWFAGTDGDFAGLGVAFVPDWTGDGGSEIAIGAYGASGATGASVGAVYILLSDSVL